MKRRRQEGSLEGRYFDQDECKICQSNDHDFMDCPNRVNCIRCNSDRHTTEECPKCYHCNIYGHIARYCPRITPTYQEAESSESQIGDYPIKISIATKSTPSRSGKRIGCYNCGKEDHMGEGCTAETLEEYLIENTHPIVDMKQSKGKWRKLTSGKVR